MDKTQAWNSKFGRISLYVIHTGDGSDQPSMEKDTNLYVWDTLFTLREIVATYLINHIDLECAYLNAAGPHLKVPEKEHMIAFIGNRILYALRYEEGQWRATIEIYDGNVTFLHLHADFIIEGSHKE